jgi:hypothetical protein
MYNINAEIVIANYFAENSVAIEMPLSKLAELKRWLENRFLGKFLFVDTTWDSISSAVRSNPKYFRFNDSRTSILFNPSQREELYEDVYAIFNSKLDLDIKYKFLTELENIIENDK